MPGRRVPLVTGEIYHVVNRGVASQPVFSDKRDYQRALDTISYYQSEDVPFRYSYLLRLSRDERIETLQRLRNGSEHLVNIIAFCLMPNHIHLLLQQAKDRGVSVYMSNISNSYTRFFNTRQERSGPLFQGKFKAVRVETGKQLLHVSRYIHLNPYTSYVVKTLQDLESYPYSSLQEYLRPKKYELCTKDLVLRQFRERNDYRKFLTNQADYQRTLEEIKHLRLEV